MRKIAGEERYADSLPPEARHSPEESLPATAFHQRHQKSPENHNILISFTSGTKNHQKNHETLISLWSVRSNLANPA